MTNQAFNLISDNKMASSLRRVNVLALRYICSDTAKNMAGPFALHKSLGGFSHFISPSGYAILSHEYVPAAP